MNLRGEKEVKRRRWKEEDRFCKFILFIYSFIYYFFHVDLDCCLWCIDFCI